MAIYIWKGKNRYGDVVSGERVAASLEEVTRALQKEQITIINVSAKRKGLEIPFLKREKVKLKELAVYSRQLSVLIDAELPLIQSLTILSEQTKNKYFKRVITTVREDVEAGSTLNQAKRKFPKAFDDLYCNLIASGEQSGSLDIMLRRLAEYIEKVVKLRAKVKQAMIYPSAIVTFAILVTIFLLWKVIPVFASIFTELGAQLPFLTAFVIGLSNFVSSYILFIFLGLIALFVGFRYFRKTERGRWAVDRFILKLPLFGELMRKVAISRITRTLSTLVAGGVPVLESLKITSSTAGNVLLETSVMESRRMVAEGKTLTEAFSETGQFPFMLTQMVSVGE
ncbi:MAG: type II secretion system F family protein, partial [Candidatus Aminicenantes bacterium]|nr:type II secretion system F family protein [Candidatus Aminicenantes bacterium]